MRVLQVNAYEEGGGAESVVRGLHEAYRREGIDAWLAVGRRRGSKTVEDMVEIPAALGRGPWAKGCLGLAGRLDRGSGGLPGAGTLRLLARPKGAWARWRGREDFDYPGTGCLLELPPRRPDVLQCHNLHGGYFDLRRLPHLSRQVPLVLTLHDTWLTTGHCAHPFECGRWETGCGQCPDLTIPPAVRRDATDINWRRKREIFSNSRLYVATPSEWLMERVKRSMLGAAAIDSRVIVNGIDNSFFSHADRLRCRRTLGLPEDAAVLLFAANTVQDNIWKDFQTVRGALQRLSSIVADRNVVLVALGEDAPDEAMGQARLMFVPYQTDAKGVANYFRAADVYLHASRAETFSLTIAEAMACGTPVVATAVGAVPERVRSLTHPSVPRDCAQFDADQATGVLVAGADVGGMADAVATLLADDDLRRRLGDNAAREAQHAYPLEKQARAYLDWFGEILESGNRTPSS